MLNRWFDGERIKDRFSQLSADCVSFLFALKSRGISFALEIERAFRLFDRPDRDAVQVDHRRFQERMP